MPSSGTTSFSASRDDIIKAALRALGRLAIGATPANEDFTNCAFALNLILKRLAAQGYLLWCYVHVTVPLVSGTSSYTLGATGSTVTNRPIRIAQAYIRDADNNDTQMEQLSKSGYDMLTPKDAPGIPVNFYYDPTLDNGTLYVWPVINTTGYNAILSIQRQVQDIAPGASSTQTFDLPQEWFEPLLWLLCKHVGPEYMVNLQKLQVIREYAREAEETISNFTREEASVYFTVDPQMNRNVL